MLAVSQQGWRRIDLRTRDAALAIVEPYDEAGVVAPVRALIARELAGDVPTQQKYEYHSEKARDVALSFEEEGSVMVRSAWTAYNAARYRRDYKDAAIGAANSAAMCASDRFHTPLKETKAWHKAWDRIADACLSAVEKEAGL